MQLKKIISVKSLGKRKTLDLEVDHKDHNFYAEGLVSSNSHSISYATLAVWTTYMKFKYTLPFLIALLRNSKYEQDPYEIIDKVSKEASKFGIKILPPDLARSSMDFTIDGDNIRYGLNAIKGISEKSLESIIEFRGAKTTNKFDVFLAAKSAKINIGILSSLIQAGALSSINDERARMVYEAQVFNILTDREKRNFINLGEKYNYDVFSIWSNEIANGKNIAADGKALVSDRRKETIKSKAEQYSLIFQKNKQHKKFANWFFERKLLGYSYSSRLKNLYDKNYGYIGIEEFASEPEGIQGKIIGIVKECRVAKSRNSGKKYCKFIISDEKAEINCFIWEALLDELSEKDSIPNKENIVSVRVRKMDGNGCSVNQLTTLDEQIYMKLSDLR